jgi:formiminoglutamase
MSIHSNAVAPNIWTGRSDSEGALARRWHHMIEPWLPGAARGVALLGFSCDEGVRRN